MTITLQAVNELIQSLESAGELSIREQKFLKLAKAYQQLAAENVVRQEFIKICFRAAAEGDDWINAGRIEGKNRQDLGLLPDGINYLYAAPQPPTDAEREELQELRRSYLTLRGENEDLQAQLYEAESQADDAAEELQERRKADSESVAEVLSNRPGNGTSIVDVALPVGTQLYLHAQPVPVVLDEVTAEDCPAFVKYDVTEIDEAWVRGFNACRAAMLSGGKS
ncbi:TPA: hypothetical protein ACJ568_000679 [Klebsiella pneumoniae]